MTNLPTEPVILYAGKYTSIHPEGSFLSHFYKNIHTVEMCGPDLGIFKVSCRISPDQSRPVPNSKEYKRLDYWGWYDFGDRGLCMIWPSKVQSDMCFPYGPEAEEERGKGKQVRLVIKELEKVG